MEASDVDLINMKIAEAMRLERESWEPKLHALALAVEALAAPAAAAATQEEEPPPAAEEELEPVAAELEGEEGEEEEEDELDPAGAEAVAEMVAATTEGDRAPDREHWLTRPLFGGRRAG